MNDQETMRSYLTIRIGKEIVDDIRMDPLAYSVKEFAHWNIKKRCFSRNPEWIDDIIDGWADSVVSYAKMLI